MIDSCISNVCITNRFTQWSVKRTSINILLAGYFWVNDILYEQEEAVDFIHNHIDLTSLFSLEQFFLRLNGSWSLIVQEDGRIVLASDIIRTIPIFYSVEDDVIHISDSSTVLRRKLHLSKLSERNVARYVESAVAFQGETIYVGLYDVEAGSLVAFDGRLEKRRYWEMPSKLKFADEKLLLARSDEIFNRVFGRMAGYLRRYEKSTIFLPLSGGMDSRLLAWAIKKYKIKNQVIAFSYGANEDVEEAGISRDVAAKLGFQWVFVEYTDNMWQTLRRNFGKINEGYNLEKSVTHFQDFFAMQRLKEDFGTGIVLPGLCFDGLAGLDIPYELKFDNFVKVEDLLAVEEQYSEDVFYYENRLKNWEQFMKNQRWSTYVVNSVRIYERLGFQYYLPFWDSELTDFWYSVPTYLRVERNLFRMYLNSRAYVDEFESLLAIPIAGGRALSSDMKRLAMHSKLLILMKFLIRSELPKIPLLGFLYARLVKKHRLRIRHEGDYLNFYQMFPESRLCEIEEILNFFGKAPNSSIYEHPIYSLHALLTLNLLTGNARNVRKDILDILE